LRQLCDIAAGMQPLSISCFRDAEFVCGPRCFAVSGP
jgi:hypothetical protein